MINYLNILSALLLAICLANDWVCDPPRPHECIPQEQLRHLLPGPYGDKGTILATGNLYQNIQTDPSLPPILLFITTITGINYQWYDRELCTLVGNFSLTSGGVIIPGTTVSWVFNTKLNWNNNNYIGYCLTDEGINQTHNPQGIILGTQLSFDSYCDSFLANKDYIRNVAPAPFGSLIQFENFKFYNDTFSQYQLTQFSTTTTGGPTTIIFFAFNRISPNVMSVNNLKAIPNFMNSNEKYHTMGRAKIPRSLIPQDKQKYFNFK